ncbi:MAG: hypothetical protein Tsb0019_05890 [Roseibium sp.]
MKRILFPVSLLLVSLLLAAGLPAKAASWTVAELPAYSDDTEFVAIGSDGLLYAVTSNPNGYVFTSLLKTYKFEPSGDGFTGLILSGKQVYYLGSSCDAASERFKGSWSVNNTGLAFAIADAGRPVMTFNLLSTGLSPSHSC